MFDLKSPCVTCPFRKGQGELFSLPRLRLREIKNATAFQCHKTVNYGEFEDRGDKPQQCAGLMAVLLRERQMNSIMQVAYRFGYLKPEKIDPRGEAYQTWGDVLKAHGATR